MYLDTLVLKRKRKFYGYEKSAVTVAQFKRMIDIGSDVRARFLDLDDNDKEYWIPLGEMLKTSFVNTYTTWGQFEQLVTADYAKARPTNPPPAIDRVFITETRSEETAVVDRSGLLFPRFISLLRHHDDFPVTYGNIDVYKVEGQQNLVWKLTDIIVRKRAGHTLNLDNVVVFSNGVACYSEHYKPDDTLYVRNAARYQRGIPDYKREMLMMDLSPFGNVNRTLMRDLSPSISPADVDDLKKHTLRFKLPENTSPRTHSYIFFIGGRMFFRDQVQIIGDHVKMRLADLNWESWGVMNQAAKQKFTNNVGMITFGYGHLKEILGLCDTKDEDYTSFVVAIDRPALKLCEAEINDQRSTEILFTACNVTGAMVIQDMTDTPVDFLRDEGADDNQLFINPPDHLFFLDKDPTNGNTHAMLRNVVPSHVPRRDLRETKNKLRWLYMENPVT